MEKFTKKLVALAGGAMLTHSVGDAKLPAQDFSADMDGKHTTEAVIQKSAETLPEGTVAYDPNEATFEATKTPTSSEINETPTVSNIEPETVNASVVASSVKAEDIAPVPEKTKTVESVVESGVELSAGDFQDVLSEVMKKMMGKNATIETLQVKGSGGSLQVQASLKALGSKIGFNGDLGTNSGMLSVERSDVDANWAIKGMVEKILKSKMAVALSQVKNHLDQRYHDVHPDGIEKLAIVDGKLKLLFK